MGGVSRLASTRFDGDATGVAGAAKVDAPDLATMGVEWLGAAGGDYLHRGDGGVGEKSLGVGLLVVLVPAGGGAQRDVGQLSLPSVDWILCRRFGAGGSKTDRKSTRLNSSHTVI